MWEMASHEFPFMDSLGGYDEIKSWIISGEREEIPQGTPRSFRQLVKKCWNGDADKRPVTKELVEQLKVLKKSYSSSELKVSKAKLLADTHEQPESVSSKDKNRFIAETGGNPGFFAPKKQSSHAAAKHSESAMSNASMCESVNENSSASASSLSTDFIGNIILSQ